MEKELAIFWFRRDLRLHDNAGLYHALQSGLPVIPLFIFDTEILSQLEDKDDARVSFIYRQVESIRKELRKLNTGFEVKTGKPENVFRELIQKYNLKKVFTNNDYEPYARKRDQGIADLLKSNSIEFFSYKDQVIFEKEELVKDNGDPYTVFTPYSRKWKSLLNPFYLKSYPTERRFSHFYRQETIDFPSLETIGFTEPARSFPSKETDTELIRHYSETRDYPGIRGTSHMGIHLRFGTISIRELVRTAIDLNETYLNELIWREFYQAILWHFPHVGEGKSFKPAYDDIHWRNNEQEFEQWCEGKTGYPLVDAGMRELSSTGYMHNRVRMVTASFLAKHLLIDWRWGEAWFARKLLDFDLASNNGGWQWSAGCGCDAAPYFRIFNPTLQAQKFDKDLKYIKRWIPELNDFTYPEPIVDHDFARKRCLEVYSAALKDRPVSIR